MKNPNEFQKSNLAVIAPGRIAKNRGKTGFSISHSDLDLAIAEFLRNGGMFRPWENEICDHKKLQREDVDGFFNDQDLSGLV